MLGGGKKARGKLIGLDISLESYNPSSNWQLCFLEMSIRMIAERITTRWRGKTSTIYKVSPSPRINSLLWGSFPYDNQDHMPDQMDPHTRVMVMSIAHQMGSVHVWNWKNWKNWKNCQRTVQRAYRQE